jgi:DNA-binding CsgD family transcriptional regulator
MLERAGAPAVERAPHWEEAGDAPRTWSTSMAAATEADRAGAFAEASANFERALAHWPEGEDGKGRAMLRAGYAAWHGNDADAALRLARDAANAGAEPFEAWLGIAQFSWDAGDREYSTEAFLNAYNALPDGSSASAQARSLWALGRARVGQGRHADAYRAGIEAAHLAIEAGDLKWAGQAWVLAGMARAWNGDIGAVEELERGLGPSLESGDPEAIGHAYQFLVGMLWQAGRLDDAARIGFEGVAACERLGLARSHGADVRGEMALALIDLGRWAEADALLEAAEARAKPIYTRGLLASRRGDFSAAERDLAAAALEPSIGGRGRLGYLDTLAIAECRWLQHDPQGAERALDAIGEPPGVWGIDMVARVALLRARLGRPGSARIEHYDAALGKAINAELAARRGDDLVAWSEAARAWEAIGHPYDLAIALLAAAEAAFATHERAAGRRNLEGALTQASSLGSAPLVERAEELARRARITVSAPRRRDIDVSALTPREVEVLQLLAEGRTNPQIAQHLFLSPKTVGIHVQRVLEKLESHTRGEAVATARRRGLLT